MNYAFKSLQDVPMRVNRMNVDAMALLSEDRGFEAVTLLQRTLSVDPLNPFTMNNLAVAYEAIGDFDSALKEYGAATDVHSSEPIVVTLNRAWRGRPVSDMAAESARPCCKYCKCLPFLASARVTASRFLCGPGMGPTVAPQSLRN